MKTPNKTETQIKQEEIAIRAYHLWEKAGRHHGHDLEFWLQAEAELNGNSGSNHRGRPATLTHPASK